MNEETLKIGDVVILYSSNIWIRDIPIKAIIDSIDHDNQRCIIKFNNEIKFGETLTQYYDASFSEIIRDNNMNNELLKALEDLKHEEFNLDAIGSANCAGLSSEEKIKLDIAYEKQRFKYCKARHKYESLIIMESKK